MIEKRGCPGRALRFLFFGLAVRLTFGAMRRDVCLFVRHKIDSYVEDRRDTRSGFLARVAPEVIANG
ncbi:hypothetical protein [Caballeronia hypogeia]|uniref:hypothetical protein n=1 Tax=Caballeronia hypogeia TaxID=1777140 RepID=UPI0012FE2759|nr:hypothetical protein [Caballeronia hypogeia]